MAIRYDIKRKNAVSQEELSNCDRLEVVRQVIKAIDSAQSFEAKVSETEEEVNKGRYEKNIL